MDDQVQTGGNMPIEPIGLAFTVLCFSLYVAARGTINAWRGKL